MNGPNVSGGAVLDDVPIFERVDDDCSAPFVYCRERQPVRPVDVAAAAADLRRLDPEEPSGMERLMAAALEGVA